jgi:hypothetical protein
MKTSKALLADSYRTQLLEAAIAYQQSGLSIIPIGQNKKPTILWKQYQQKPMNEATLKRNLLAPAVTGIAAVCGAVSCNLLIIDFDILEFYHAWRQTIGRIAEGFPLQQTGEGYQVALRCDKPGQNVPLAWAPNPEMLEGREIAIETRGEGGYALLPPSIHPNGKYYKTLEGDFTRIPYVEMVTVDKLLKTARVLDEAPFTLKEMIRQPLKSDGWMDSQNGQINVIAAFNDANSIGEILERYSYEVAPRGRYRRPGGTSGSVAIIDERYSYHWSTNDPLCDGHRHDAFSIYCSFEFDDDVRAAVKAAAKQLGLSPFKRITSISPDLEAEIPIIPLPNTEVKPFPVQVFPNPLRQFIQEGTKAIGCPPEFLAVPLLVFAGTAIGTSRILQIKPSWCEGSRVYAAIVADPGSKKSPALELTLSPFWKQQQRKEREHQQALELYQKEHGEKEPCMEQIITTDSTLEALAVLLEQNPRGLVFCRDELTGWVRSMNQYKGGYGADRQAWLSFWSGAKAIVNRKNRKAPLILDKPFVSVVGALPPDMLTELTDERGREDGFIHRILFSYPERITPHWTDESMDSNTLTNIEIVFGRLWDLKPVEGVTGKTAPKTVCFTEDGKNGWVDWINGHYAEQEKPDFPDNLLGPWSKMDGYCARLALILHQCRVACNEVESEEVDEVSVTGAATLIEYFKAHAKRVYAQLRVTPEDKKVILALKWIERHGGRATVRDIMRYGVTGIKTHDESQQLLYLLRERGYGIVEEKVPQNGGRKSICFTLHKSLTTDKSR